jgi:hypothetical protein
VSRSPRFREKALTWWAQHPWVNTIGYTEADLIDAYRSMRRHSRNHLKSLHYCGGPYKVGCPLHGGYNRRNRKGRPSRPSLSLDPWTNGEYGWM